MVNFGEGLVHLGPQRVNLSSLCRDEASRAASALVRSVAPSGAKFDSLDETPSIRRFNGWYIWIATSSEILWYAINSCGGAESPSKRFATARTLAASRGESPRWSACKICIDSNPSDTGSVVGSGLFSEVFKSIKGSGGKKNSLIHAECTQSMEHVNLCKFGRKELVGKYRSKS